MYVPDTGYVVSLMLRLLYYWGIRTRHAMGTKLLKGIGRDSQAKSLLLPEIGSQSVKLQQVTSGLLTD
jgi:hypothetical protein